MGGGAERHRMGPWILIWSQWSKSPTAQTFSNTLNCMIYSIVHVRFNEKWVMHWSLILFNSFNKMLSLDHPLAVDKGASRQFYAKKGKKKNGGFAKKRYISDCTSIMKPPVCNLWVLVKAGSGMALLHSAFLLNWPALEVRVLQPSFMICILGN